MEEITRMLLYILELLPDIIWAEWTKGICLGADISLPPCLATGIWNLAPKATSRLKSRGASFGTTLWHHVQRYCCFGILLAHAQLPYNWRSYHIRGENIHIRSTKYNTPLMSFTGASFLNKWIRISVCRWNQRFRKQVGNTLLEVKPCTSDTEPGVVEETIRIKEQPENENDLEPSTTKAGKLETTNTQLNHPDQVFVNVSDSPYRPKNFKDSNKWYWWFAIWTTCTRKEQN